MNSPQFKKPNHLTQENFDLIMKDAYSRLSFGFAEPGERVTVSDGKVTLEFVGTFDRKKDAETKKNETENSRVMPYLYGRYKTGWTVLKKI